MWSPPFLCPRVRGTVSSVSRVSLVAVLGPLQTTCHNQFTDADTSENLMRPITQSFRSGIKALTCFLFLFTMSSLRSVAQTNPTFGTAYNLSPSATLSTPASVSYNGYIFIFYQSKATGNLAMTEYYRNGNVEKVTDSGFPMSSPSVAAAVFNSNLYVLFATSSGFKMTTYKITFSSVGFTSATPVSIASPTGSITSRNPSMTVWNGKLYLSVTVPNQTYASQQDIAIFSSTDAVNFSNEIFPTDVGGQALGGSSLTTFTATGSSTSYLCVAFTQSGTNHLIVFFSTNGINYNGGANDNTLVGGDPTLVPFSVGGRMAVYAFFRSYYSGHNIWTVGTYDAYNFSASSQYSATTPLTPGAVIDPNTGDLLVPFAANDGSNNLYIYTAAPQ